MARQGVLFSWCFPLNTEWLPQLKCHIMFRQEEEVGKAVEAMYIPLIRKVEASVFVSLAKTGHVDPSGSKGGWESRCLVFPSSIMKACWGRANPHVFSLSWVLASRQETLPASSSVVGWLIKWFRVNSQIKWGYTTVGMDFSNMSPLLLTVFLLFIESFLLDYQRERLLECSKRWERVEQFRFREGDGLSLPCCYFHAVWPWAAGSTFLSLGFYICKMEIRRALTSLWGGYEGEMRPTL